MDRREFTKLVAAGATGFAGWPLELLATDEVLAVEGGHREKLDWLSHHSYGNGTGLYIATISNPSAELWQAVVRSLCHVNASSRVILMPSGSVQWHAAGTIRNDPMGCSLSRAVLRLRLDVRDDGHEAYVLNYLGDGHHPVGEYRRVQVHGSDGSVDFVIARLSALARELQPAAIVGPE